MDSSRLAPGPFGGPDRNMQIKDAKDMYQTVLRNAERSGSAVPPYDFVELIGKGAFGRVYKCREQSTGELVAVKIINIDDADFQEHVLEKDNTIDSFRKEVGILQQLKDNNAQNINMIHDAFDLHNQLWIVSDYCTGGSVRTLMRANPTSAKGLEEDFIIPIARELALAMKSVHDIGVIHRDIKCANVYVNEEGEIQLGDFGIVGVMDDGASKRRTIIGTPHYLPRELLVAASHLTDEGYGTEVDIWSYGITVFEMATGQPPHSTMHPDDVAKVIGNAPRLEGGSYSAELRDFVAFCLNSNPLERPSADAVLRHPFIADTSSDYPTSSLVRLIERYATWEFRGGQRQSLFFRGGAAAPSSPEDEVQEDNSDVVDWNFSTSDNFNVEFGKRYSQMVATQDFAQSNAPIQGLPPIDTKNLTNFERIQEQFRELSANRGERSLDRLWNPDTEPYELHTPIEDSAQLSDLPLRNISGPAPTRESLIDLDSAAAIDAGVPTFNFDFGDVPTLKARTSRNLAIDEPEEEEAEYGSSGVDERRATMEWTFPSEERRATMDWTFSTARPSETEEAVASMKLPVPGANGQLAPGFRPNLQRTATEPVGQFNDFMHPPQPLIPTTSAPARDSVSSMIDLDVGLADPADIVRPSTASSATGSTSTMMTSGNPFDLEEDPEQNEIDRNRFSYHKQWQSEGGQQRRPSLEPLRLRSRGDSTASTDSDFRPSLRGHGSTSVLDYDYRIDLSKLHGAPLLSDIHVPDGSFAQWPDFDSSMDYSSAQSTPMEEAPYGQQPLQHHRLNGSSVRSISRHGEPGRAAQPTIELPALIAQHPDTLLDGVDPQLFLAEFDRMLDGMAKSLDMVSKVFRHQTSQDPDDTGSETDEGFESSAAPTGDEDGF